MSAGELVGNLRARNWPIAAGAITLSEIGTLGQKYDTVYFAKIRYAYEVDQKSYEGKRISFGQAYSDSSSGDWTDTLGNRIFGYIIGGKTPLYGDNDRTFAVELIKKYPVGSNVQVYYNPRAPSQAVLEPTVEWCTTRSLFRAFLMIAIACLWEFIRLCWRLLFPAKSNKEG